MFIKTHPSIRTRSNNFPNQSAPTTFGHSGWLKRGHLRSCWRGSRLWRRQMRKAAIKNHVRSRAYSIIVNASQSIMTMHFTLLSCWRRLLRQWTSTKDVEYSKGYALIMEDFTHLFGPIRSQTSVVNLSAWAGTRLISQVRRVRRIQRAWTRWYYLVEKPASFLKSSTFPKLCAWKPQRTQWRFAWFSYLGFSTCSNAKVPPANAHKTSL